ncbi:MAG: neocarzinostatin apoprotein domain-containing protein [Corynebacterium sp.]|nr:neocarzinostatin apoprotein domain-containing protein [Corynebacterium sp.]
MAKIRTAAIAVLAATPLFIGTAAAAPVTTLPNVPDMLSALTPLQSESNGQLTLSSSTLADGETAKVHGSSFPAGEAIYVTQTIERPAVGFPMTYADAQKVTVGADGTFDTEIVINREFKGVDCATTQCYIASFTAFPKLYDRSNDVWEPITVSGVAQGTSQDSTQGANTDVAGAGTTGSSQSAAGNANTGTSAATGSTAANSSSTVSSSSGASVSVDRTQGLNPAGDVVHVTGRGFSTSGNGIYVGVAEQSKFSTTNADVFSPDTTWVTTARRNLKADGSFSIDLPVQAVFGDSNCQINSCAIYTFAAHGSPDRSQDTVTPISFGSQEAAAAQPIAAGSTGSGSASSGSTSNSASSGSASNSASSGSAMNAAKPTSSAGSSSATGATSSSGASVSLSTTTIAASGATPITINGSGFKTTGNGVYVGVVEKNKFSWTDASVYGAVEWIRTSDMTDNGDFSVTLDVEPIFTNGNCIENQCAIYTFAAHGSEDRSQDTATDLTVAGTEEEKQEALEAAESSAAATSSAVASAQASADEEATTRVQADSVENTSSTAPWVSALWGALGGAIVVALAWLLSVRRRSPEAES